MASAPVAVVTVEPRPTAVVAQATTWSEFPRLWPRLLDEVYAVVRATPRPADGGASERWQNVMLYKDQTPSVEVGVLADEPFSPAGRVVSSQLPGGRAAMAVHRGAYAGLGDTHAAVRQYVADHGLEPAGPLWEIYGHWRADPDELETEIYWLLR